MLASKMDGVVAILQKANQLPTNEEGEVELDLRYGDFIAGVCVLIAVLDLPVPGRLQGLLRHCGESHSSGMMTG